MWSAVHVIAVCTATLTSAVAILAGAQPVAAQHVVPSQGHATVTRKAGGATARIT